MSGFMDGSITYIVNVSRSHGRINFVLQDILPKPPNTYIDDVLAALKHAFEDHVQRLDNMLTALHQAGFQVNLKKSYSCQKELEFLGFGCQKQDINL